MLWHGIHRFPIFLCLRFRLGVFARLVCSDMPKGARGGARPGAGRKSGSTKGSSVAGKVKGRAKRSGGAIQERENVKRAKLPNIAEMFKSRTQVLGLCTYGLIPCMCILLCMQNTSNSLPSTSQDVQMAVSDPASPRPMSSKVEVVRSKYVTSAIICSLQASEMSDEEDFEEIKDVKVQLRHSQPTVTQASGAAHLSFSMMLYVWFSCRPVPVLLCSVAPLHPHPLRPLLFRFQSLFVQLRVSSWSSPRLLVELAQFLRQIELICIMKLTPKAMTR